MVKVTIIIPNYNNQQWLTACLDSCISQKGDFIKEIIVVDDQSTDDSWRFLQDFQRTHSQEVFIYQNPQKGGNAARNYGFSKATGDYIQWLDSDDVLLPEKLKTQVDFFENNPEIDIVYSDWRMDYYEEDIKIYEEVNQSRSFDTYLKALISEKWQPNLSYLLRRGVADHLDGIQAWNPSRKVAQDREYFNLAAIHGARFAYVPGLFSVYNRWSKGSVSMINYKKRQVLSLELDQKLIHEIRKQQWLQQNEKRDLIGILKTNALKSTFYQPTMKMLEPISFFNIHWSTIHYKMRPFIPFIWFYQSIRFYLNKLFHSS